MIKISNEQFIGEIELNKLIEDLTDKGFEYLLQQKVLTFGIFRNAYLYESTAEFSNFLVKAGATLGSINIDKGTALDKNLNVLKLSNALINYVIPNDNTWYWIKIKQKKEFIEQGTVNIDANGNIIGTGTLFTKTLRGGINFPNKIRLYTKNPNNTDLNNFTRYGLLDYDVLTVNSDTSAVINTDASFTAINGYYYSVLGVFSDDFVPNVNVELPYEKDSVAISLVAELALNTKPTFLQDEEFFIARVKNNAGIITIIDKRSDFCFFEAEIDKIPITDTNNLIGVEAIRYPDTTSPGNANLVQLSWGFTVKNFSVNFNQNLFSIIEGNGGRFKNVTFFNDNDFDEWLIYNQFGRNVKILRSITNGSQVDLTVDILDEEFVADYADLVKSLYYIVPNYKSVNIFAKQGVVDVAKNQQEIKTAEFQQSFDIIPCTVQIPLNTYGAKTYYNLFYSYDNLNQYGERKSFLESIFFPENQFNIITQIPNETLSSKAYSDTLATGQLELIRSPQSYQSLKDRIDTKNLFGVNVTGLQNSDPITDLYVDFDKEYQYFIEDVTLLQNFVISVHNNANAVVNRRDNIARDGNFFILHFYSLIELSTFTIEIRENYNDTVDNGTLLHTFDLTDVAVSNPAYNEQGIRFELRFNGTNWFLVNEVLSPKQYVKTLIYNTITLRNNAPVWDGKLVHVTDASADTTVGTGFAGYVYVQNQWRKIYQQIQIQRPKILIPFTTSNYKTSSMAFSVGAVDWNILSGANNDNAVFKHIVPAQSDKILYRVVLEFYADNVGDGDFWELQLRTYVPDTATHIVRRSAVARADDYVGGTPSGSIRFASNAHRQSCYIEIPSNTQWAVGMFIDLQNQSEPRKFLYIIEVESIQRDLI
jgi:hypothetical protein